MRILQNATSPPTTPAHVVSVLKRLVTYLTYVREKPFKINSYRKAIATLESLPADTVLRPTEDLTHLPYIGKSIDSKIREILETSTLALIPDSFVSDEQALKVFTTIVNIGPATAKKWIRQGIRDLSQLKLAIESGEVHHPSVEHWMRYIDGEIRMKDQIPRSEMDDLVSIVTNRLRVYNPLLRVHVCGSYRRGALTSNDIDILLINPKYTTLPLVKKSKELGSVVQFLIDEKILFDHLTHKIDNLQTKYMGLVPSPSIPNVVRRIDLRLMPTISEAAAMLYFTGSMKLNQRMRTLAKGKGMLLNEYGLIVVAEHAVVAGHAVVAEHAVVAGHAGTCGMASYDVTTEADIFTLLDMKYIEPFDR